MPEVIESHNGHDVTESAISCNLGSGLMESMRIAPGVWNEGDLIDVVVRMRVGEVSHKPVHKDDFDGPYRRIHRAKALALTPTTHTTVGGILDKHIGQVRKAREVPGQSSIDYAIEGNGKVTSIKKASRKRSQKRHPASKATAEASEPTE
jgi:hypothetical protein